MTTISITHPKLIQLHYFEALAREKYSDSSTTHFVLDYISSNTKVLIYTFMETGNINVELLHHKSIEEINYLGYDELVKSILLLPSLTLIKYKILTKQKVILDTMMQHPNELIFASELDFKRYMDTGDSTLLTDDGKYGFIHMFSNLSDISYYKLFKKLLEHPKININIKNKNGRTALISASKHSYISSVIVRDLLQHSNIDPNIQDHDGWTALMTASRYSTTGSSEQTVRDLLAHPNIDPNLQNNAGWTALRLASSNSITDSSEQTVRDLLEHTNNHYTCLCCFL